jgi:hypothetical protein
MYAPNQMNGLAGRLGEVRQDPNGNLYQLGEIVDERGNIGLGWQPYDQPQLGEVRRGADGQSYQYGVDGLGNIGWLPFAALASKVLPAIANIIPGLRNLLPGGQPASPTPGSMPVPFQPGYPRIIGYLNSLVPRIVNETAQATTQQVLQRLEPLLTRQQQQGRGRGRGRRGVAGIGEEPYPYGVGEDPYLYGMGERDYENLGIGEEDLGENDYPPLSGVDGYQRQEPGGPLDGYVKRPPSSGPAFVSRETPSELWKPLW